MLPLQILILSSCQDCCSFGGRCETAFKGMQGVCCGSSNGYGKCCPIGYRCFPCRGEYRCAAPYERIVCTSEEDEFIGYFLLSLSLLFLLFAIGNCVHTARRNSVQSASPSNGEGSSFGSGLLAGVLVGEMMGGGGEQCTVGILSES